MNRLAEYLLKPTGGTSDVVNAISFLYGVVFPKGVVSGAQGFTDGLLTYFSIAAAGAPVVAAATQTDTREGFMIGILVLACLSGALNEADLTTLLNEMGEMKGNLEEWWNARNAKSSEMKGTQNVWTDLQNSLSSIMNYSSRSDDLLRIDLPPLNYSVNNPMFKPDNDVVKKKLKIAGVLTHSPLGNYITSPVILVR